MYTHHAQVLSNDIGAAPDVAALVGFSQRLPAVLVQHCFSSADLTQFFPYSLQLHRATSQPCTFGFPS